MAIHRVESKPAIGIARRDFVKRAGAALSGAALLTNAQGAADPSYVVAETSFGKIRGTEIQGIKVFKGIPYGASTAGDNRFMPPVQPEPWVNVRDALEYGHTAPQRDPAAKPGPPAGWMVIPQPRMEEGEDCLVLNVWTPALQDNRKRPVMVWLHGGGFNAGSGSESILDGTNLCKRGDVVLVTINHRVNALGFTFLGDLAGPDFAQSGDVGMLDIVHALKWVRDNIAHFGGDPNTVTVFGQSGGGRKVGTLLAMPSAKGLFHRAIIESGPTIKLVERDQATKAATLLLAKLGLNKTQARQLQKIPIDQFMTAYHAVVRTMGVDQMTAGFSPTMDGSVIPQHPFHPAASAVSPDVPVMVGSARTELRLHYRHDAATFALDENGMRARVEKILAANAGHVIDVYRKANPGATPVDLFFLIASDFEYGTPIMKIAERRAALGKAPVYLYYFTWESPVEGGTLKSPHTIEMPFAFDNVKIAAPLVGTGPETVALADKVSSTWIAFARTGDPNTSKLPHWPRYNAVERPTMVFNNVSKVEKDPIQQERVAMFNAMNLT